MTKTNVTDTALRQAGYQYLMEKLGLVGAERFISLIIAEPFDYTVWRESLYENMSVRELSKKAEQYHQNNLDE
jgi:hypothetical protein